MEKYCFIGKVVSINNKDKLEIIDYNYFLIDF